ncbi:adenylate/guanylate cyclase domain-containing protein [Mycolicibacterium aromaticivorans]|nr:adenylate/guanylate cyclase domain-containing protein [Mycolicibacterium aromaticivorans]
MLLSVSIVSVVIAGAIGYVSGTTSLRNAEYQRLTQLRESRAREITSFYSDISDAASIVTHGTQTIAAANEFAKAFAELQTTPLPPGAEHAVATYYSTVFGPTLAQRTGQPVDASLFQPTSNAATYLQSLYTVPAQGDYEKALNRFSAGDPSAWSAVNARYQPFFADLTQRFKFEDAMILDTQGNVVYTAYKGVDLGTNVTTGPYSTTVLGTTYRKALQATSIDQTFISDFERYAPSYGRPTQWVLSPIGRDGAIAGVLALQMSLDSVNDVMTGQGRWVQDGLGQSGETYLAGPDKLMRSVSRELLTDPKHYAEEVIADGTPDDVAKRQVDVKGSVLLQPVDKMAVNRALIGESGVTTARDYIGPEALVAYAPLAIPGLDWVLVAKIDKSEALAPVNTFARNIALSTAAIVLAVSLLALLFSRILTRPIKRLATAVRRVAGGELGVNVPVGARDEIGELASAFNDMSVSLQTKQHLIDEQRQENDELLASLMPEPVARRYRDGEENISTHYRDVSVIYAQLLGFDEFSRSMPSAESVAMLNSLAEAFDGAAERHGVEQVRSMQDNGLLATCGLVVPRVDHASRTIAFASEITEIVHRFNDQHDARLAIRAGIDSGPVTSGLVGQRSKIYALWGEAVDLANRVHASTKAAGVFVSDRVHEAVVGIYTFSDAGTLSGADGNEPVWRLDVGTRHPA